MRERWSSNGRLTVFAVSVAALAACGGGGAQVRGPDAGDAGVNDAARPVDVGADSVAPGGDAAPDLGGNDVAATPDSATTPDATSEVGAEVAATDAASDRLAEVSPEVAPPKADAGVDLKLDLPLEKPPASAMWTIAPGPTCTAAGVGCMDTGEIGGYQVTASGVCGGASSLQLWFPGGQSAVAPGTYAVKVASGILDVINMQAGMVGVLAERDEGNTHARYWGRAGTATVTVAGGGRRIALSGVSLAEETSGAMKTLAADGTCP